MSEHRPDGDRAVARSLLWRLAPGLAQPPPVARIVDTHGFSNVLQLMSLCAPSAKARGVDELLIAVHPHHVRFYQGFFGFTLLGEQRSYGAVLNAPAVALELDPIQLAEHHPRSYERLFTSRFRPRCWRTGRCQTTSAGNSPCT